MSTKSLSTSFTTKDISEYLLKNTKFGKKVVTETSFNALLEEIQSIDTSLPDEEFESILKSKLEGVSSKKFIKYLQKEIEDTELTIDNLVYILNDKKKYKKIIKEVECLESNKELVKLISEIIKDNLETIESMALVKEWVEDNLTN